MCSRKMLPNVFFEVQFDIKKGELYDTYIRAKEATYVVHVCVQLFTIPRPSFSIYLNLSEHAVARSFYSYCVLTEFAQYLIWLC